MYVGRTPVNRFDTRNFVFRLGASTLFTSISLLPLRMHAPTYTLIQIKEPRTQTLLVGIISK